MVVKRSAGRVLCALAVALGATGAKAEWTAWTTMHPQSFPRTPAAAAAQFLEQGASEANANLLQRELETFMRDGASDRCWETESSPGERYTHLGMNSPGRPSTANNQVQQLGRSVPVVRCHIGGVSVDWFSEPVRGCNNLGRLLVRYEPPARRCRTVMEVEKTTSPGMWIEAESFNAPLCNCSGYVHMPGATVVVPGSTNKRWTLKRVCN